MERLPPTLREKQRYLHFKVHAEEELDLGEVVDAAWDASLDYLGALGTSEADFWVIGNKFDEEKQEGVVKVNRDSMDELRAALTLIDSFNGVDGFVEVKKVSGTMDSLDI